MAVAARVCARHRIHSLHERAAADPPDPVPDPRPAGLSPSQVRVLQAMVEHGSIRAAARALRASPETVRTHLRVCRAALGVHHIPVLIAAALRAGVIT